MRIYNTARDIFCTFLGSMGYRGGGASPLLLISAPAARENPDADMLSVLSAEYSLIYKSLTGCQDRFNVEMFRPYPVLKNFPTTTFPALTTHHHSS